MGCSVSQAKAIEINKSTLEEEEFENQDNNDRVLKNPLDGSNSDEEDNSEEELPTDPLSIIIMGIEQNMYKKKHQSIDLKEFRKELKEQWAEIKKTRPKITYHQFLLEHNKIKDN